MSRVTFQTGEWLPEEQSRSEFRPRLLAFEFEVPGEPLSKARPRVVRGRAFTPETTLRQERRVAEAYPGAMLEGDLCVECVFYAGTAVRRDVDNQLKLVLDALNGVAYEDDHQVKQIHATVKRVEKSAAKTVIRVHWLLP